MSDRQVAKKNSRNWLRNKKVIQFEKKNGMVEKISRENHNSQLLDDYIYFLYFGINSL